MPRLLSALLVSVLCLAATGSGFVETADAQRKKRKAARRNQGRTNPSSAQLQRLRRQQQARQKALQRARANANRNRPAGKGTATKRNANSKKSKKETTPKRNVEKTALVLARSWKETETLLAKQKGRIAVAYVWASWCKSCTADLPALVALRRKYSKDVVAYTFNVEKGQSKEQSLERIRVGAKELLTQHGAFEVDNAVSRDPHTQVLETLGTSSVPVVLVYDRAGKLAKKFEFGSKEGAATSFEKTVVPFVEKLVKTK